VSRVRIPRAALPAFRAFGAHGDHHVTHVALESCTRTVTCRGAWCRILTPRAARTPRASDSWCFCTRSAACRQRGYMNKGAHDHVVHLRRVFDRDQAVGFQSMPNWRTPPCRRPAGAS
jgi:hypothetical protein